MRSTAASGLVVALLAGTALPASALEVLVHRISTEFEDGDPKLDAEPVNDIVRWKSGAVHVVVGNFGVQGAFVNSQFPHYDTAILEIEAGAIVKIAADFQVNEQGTVTSWTPPQFGNTGIAVIDGGAIEIDGAVLTDIRDDTHGGDTNQDSAASAPATTWYLRFGGTESEVVSNSTIRYAKFFEHLGSMTIRNNEFDFFGGIANGAYGDNTRDIALGTSPLITENDFEMVQVGPGSLDLRGQSPIIDLNTFRGPATAIKIGAQVKSPTLVHYSPPGPQSGVTVVSNNHIQTKRGIVMDTPSGRIYEQIRFRGEIRGNTLDCIEAVCEDGLHLNMATDVFVEDNDVTNYFTPFVVNPSGVDLAKDESLGLLKLRLRNNRFSTQGVSNLTAPSVPDTIFKREVFLDAEHNWWGDASGPLDSTIQDVFGYDPFYNPLGKGIKIGQGIDYAPFIGNSPEPRDSIEIDGVVQPQPLPKAPEQISIDPNVRFNLKTATSGEVSIIARNEGGQILGQSSTPHDVTSAGNTVNVAPILVTVPDSTRVITVEAVLVPDGPGDTVRSNLQIIRVSVPPSRIRLACIGEHTIDIGCPPLNMIAGNLYQVRFGMEYSSAETLHVKLRLFETDDIDLLQEFPSIEFDVPPAPNGTAEKNAMLTFPVRGRDGGFEQQLSVRLEAKNDQGEVVGLDFGYREVYQEANRVNLASPAKFYDDPTLQGASRSYAVTGEKPTIVMPVIWTIGTSAVTNWKVVAGPRISAGKNGSPLDDYTSRASLGGLVTGNHTTPENLVVLTGSDPPLHADAAELWLEANLRTVGDLTVARKHSRADVRNSATHLKKTVPPGASTQSYASVSASLDFTSNQTSGDVTVRRLWNDFEPTVPTTATGVAGTLRSTAAAEATSETLIPLNRFWSIYGTLAHNTYAAKLHLTYDPDEDFPDDPRFKENSLVIAGVNPNGGSLDVLPSVLNAANDTITTDLLSTYESYVVASKVEANVPTCGDPNGDSKVTAADALFVLKAGVGAASCDLCVCDVGKNGSISAGDALQVLRVAVGASPSPTCNACS